MTPKEFVRTLLFSILYIKDICQEEKLMTMLTKMLLMLFSFQAIF